MGLVLVVIVPVPLPPYVVVVLAAPHSFNVFDAVIDRTRTYSHVNRATLNTDCDWLGTHHSKWFKKKNNGDIVPSSAGAGEDRKMYLLLIMMEMFFKLNVRPPKMK